METLSASLRAEPFKFAARSVFLGLALCFVGGGLILKPSLMGARFESERGAAESIATCLGAALIVLGAGAVAWTRCVTPRARLWLQCALAAGVYLALSLSFRDWHIDDAAITYAYSENLVRGYGLVLHPSHAPEEAYSSTLWMLLLALLHVMGIDVALGAKGLATLIGASTAALVFVILREMFGKPVGAPAFVLTIAGFSVPPFLIWTISGLEHCMQALVFVAFVWSVLDERRLLRWAPWLGVMLVLLRPEAPLVIASFVLALGITAYQQHKTWSSILGLWRIAVFPMLALLGLLSFRYGYFGDLMPTPYYAKVQGSGTLRLLNPFSGGYRYAWDWLSRGGGFLLLMPLFFGSLYGAPRAIHAALGVVAGQLVFVAYAGGDWMGQWRFLAAPIAVLTLIAAYAIERASQADARRAQQYAGFAAVGLLMCNLPLLVTFRAKPTTPYATVTAVGESFVELAKRLGVKDPLLAHHDAGGTSYRAKIALLDLAGLGDRVVATHLEEPEFLRKYILEVRKPDFVFGVGDAFAAGISRFQDTPEFQRDYVRIEFRNRPYMQADLCHVRRALVHDSDRVIVERDGTVATRVVVTGDGVVGE